MDYLVEPEGGETNPIVTFVVGLLLGCAVGAVALLLLAPDKGSRTRKQFRKQGRAFRHDAVEAVDDALGQARRTARRGRKAVEETVEAAHDKGEQVLDEQRERVAAAIDSGKRKFQH